MAGGNKTYFLVQSNGKIKELNIEEKWLYS
jgi:hypothetical protein